MIFLEGIYKKAAEPESLHEAAAVLHGLLPAGEIAEIAAVKQQSDLFRWHMSLGDYVRDQFKLEDPGWGSPLCPSGGASRGISNLQQTPSDANTRSTEPPSS